MLSCRCRLNHSLVQCNVFDAFFNLRQIVIDISLENSAWIDRPTALKSELYSEVLADSGVYRGDCFSPPLFIS